MQSTEMWKPVVGYEEPNLRAYDLRKGYRNCYACALAYGRCRGRGVPFDSELADKIYSELIA